MGDLILTREVLRLLGLPPRAHAAVHSLHSQGVLTVKHAQSPKRVWWSKAEVMKHKRNQAAVLRQMARAA
jgi:hypothetical protein